MFYMIRYRPPARAPRLARRASPGSQLEFLSVIVYYMVYIHIYIYIYIYALNYIMLSNLT